MRKLNRYQAKTIKMLSKHDHEEAFGSRLRDGAIDTDGLTTQQVATCLGELKAQGLIRVVYNEDKTDFSVSVSSDGLAYASSRRLEILKTIGKYAFQLLVGASGGLVVLLVSMSFTTG